MSAAGSVPSGAPNQASTSGPLAWWKPTTVTSGTKSDLVADRRVAGRLEYVLVAADAGGVDSSVVAMIAKGPERWISARLAEVTQGVGELSSQGSSEARNIELDIFRLWLVVMVKCRSWDGAEQPLYTCHVERRSMRHMEPLSAVVEEGRARKFT